MSFGSVLESRDGRVVLQMHVGQRRWREERRIGLGIEEVMCEVAEATVLVDGKGDKLDLVVIQSCDDMVSNGIGGGTTIEFLCNARLVGRVCDLILVKLGPIREWERRGNVGGWSDSDVDCNRFAARWGRA